MRGILLLGTDEVIESRAKRHKIALQRGNSPGLPFAKTLITAPGTRVPWELLPAAWGLLETWDAAVPLWRYDATAESVGTAEERAVTQAAVRDLRVLLHSYELLFVRKNEAGGALIDTWWQECTGGGDKRLGFLRAMYRVKPRLCVLPTSWLADIEPLRIVKGPPAQSPNARKALVMVELEPGRLVKCHAGDEEKVLAQFRRQRQRR
jgi:hypothetical protein